jgi:acetyltransferase EpsM
MNVRSNRKPQVVIWGASGHALVVADILRLRNEFEIAGFLDDVNIERHGQEFCGASILGGREQLDRLYHQGIRAMIFGFGDCEARLELSEYIFAKGFFLVSAIHPNATIASDVDIGVGTVIAAGVVINSGTTIGKNVIVNTSASIDHECIIEDGVHICPGVHLGGRVTIGRAAWIGIGSIVAEHTTIGNGSFIGAGAVVIQNIPNGVLAYGVPAKVTKTLTINEMLFRNENPHQTGEISKSKY